MRTTITALLLFTCMQVRSQAYVSLMTGLYTNPGTFGQRSTADVEVGKQWDVFSMGLDIGKTNLAPKHVKDTTWYLEVRPNLNVFRQGIFTNTLTIGLGYIFGAQENTLTEFTTGIELTPNNHTSYNLYFGTYYLTGRYSTTTNNFFGVSLMYYFRETHLIGLFNKKEKHKD